MTDLGTFSFGSSVITYIPTDNFSVVNMTYIETLGINFNRHGILGPTAKLSI